MEMIIIKHLCFQNQKNLKAYGLNTWTIPMANPLNLYDADVSSKQITANHNQQASGI